MTNRERLFTLLRGEKPDRVPWFADLDYWYKSAKHDGTLPPEYEGEGYFQLNRDYKTGFYLQGMFPFLEEAEGVTVRTEMRGQEIVRVLSTPVGELTEIQRFLPLSRSWASVKHLVTEEDDLAPYRYYIDSLHFTPAYDELNRRSSLIGDNGVLLCYAPRTPFMHMTAVVTGVETLVYMLADMPEETDALLTAVGERYGQACRIAIDSPAELVMIPENMTSEVAGSYFDRYIRPYEEMWAMDIRKAGKTSLIHMDGALRGLIRKVAKVGFDVIEATTPAPDGDMTIDELGELDLGNTILWGGIPGSMFTPHVPEAAFRSHVIHTLEIMRREPRFVLGAADQVPPDGLLERVRTIGELCDIHGRYLA